MTKTATGTVSIIESARQALADSVCFALVRFPGETEATFYPSASKNPTDDAYFVVKPWLNVEPEYFFAESQHGSEGLKFQVPSQSKISSTAFADYTEQFEQLHAEITARKIDKAILSRVLVHPLASDLDEVDAFEQLALRYPKALVYLILHPTEGLWIGASPELLLRRKGSHYNTISLAGTANPENDQSWRNKEREEHAFVSMHIKEVIQTLQAQNVEISAPYQVSAGPVMHLKTDFNFELDSKPASQLDLLKPLHPTPAIAGWPVKQAITAINRIESHERSLYGGYLGRVAGENWDFYVNLRCARLIDRQLECFVGGGITAHSQLELEWAETTLKAATLISAIGHE